MAQKKLSVYGNLVSTANNKVENLYLVVDDQSIVFVVKNTLVNEFVAIEHFVNTSELPGWNQLIGFLQNNSTLIHSVFNKIYFVMNAPRMLLTVEHAHEDALQYAKELQLIFGAKNDEEIYTTPLDANHCLVYGVPDELSSLLTRTFPTGKWQHYASFLLQNNSNDEVQVVVFDAQLIIHIKEQGKTKLFNYFPFGGKDQNIYTVLNACIQAGVDTNLIDLKVIGHPKDHSNLIATLIPYFRTGAFSSIADAGIGAALNKEIPDPIYAPYFIF
jgi:hypothetical protein